MKISPILAAILLCGANSMSIAQNAHRLVRRVPRSGHFALALRRDQEFLVRLGVVCDHSLRE